MGRLNDQLADLSASFSLPDEIRESLHFANEELTRSGAAPGLAVGDRAPDFTLPDASGEPVALADRLRLGPVVLSFYRGDWCPYCNLELRALQANLPEIRELGASLIAISPQAPDHGAALTEREGLGFDVLSDIHQEAIRAYQLQFTPPASVKEVYANVFGNDLSKQSADGSWDLPVPATFVLDRDGVVRAAYVDAQYTTRMEPGDILDALRHLR
jgi:peroxiredoxin